MYIYVYTYIYIRLVKTKLPYKLVKRPQKRADRQIIYVFDLYIEEIF